MMKWRQKLYWLGLLAVSRQDQYILKMHIKMRHMDPEVLFQCNLCSKMFTRKAHLKRHLRIHNPDKPYKCPHCDYRLPVVPCCSDGSLETLSRSRCLETMFHRLALVLVLMVIVLVLISVLTVTFSVLVLTVLFLSFKTKTGQDIWRLARHITNGTVSVTEAFLLPDPECGTP